MTSIEKLEAEDQRRILRLLSIYDAVRTSVVPPEWPISWVNLPSLVFKMEEYEIRHPNLNLQEVELQHRFMSFINEALRHRHGYPIKEIQVIFLYYLDSDIARDYLNSWMWNLREMKVKNLLLHFGGQEDLGLETCYEFHLTDLERVNSKDPLRVLSLNGCSLRLPSRKLNRIFITVLVLGCLRGEFVTQINQLLVACVNLQTFELRCHGRFDKLVIESKKLKVLMLVGLGELHFDGDKNHNLVEICAPQLTSIEFRGFCIGMYDIKEVMLSLKKATVYVSTRQWWEFSCWTNVIQALSNVTELTIPNIFPSAKDKDIPQTSNAMRTLLRKEGMMTKFMFGAAIFSEAFKFHKLKRLTLHMGFHEHDILQFADLLKKCPNLEKMVIDCHPILLEHVQVERKMIDDRSKVVLQIPYLKEVDMVNFIETINERYVAELLETHGALVKTFCFGQ